MKGWRTSSQCKSANESNVRFPLSVRSPLLHAHGTFSPLEEHIMRGPQVDRGNKPCWGLARMADFHNDDTGASFGNRGKARSKSFGSPGSMPDWHLRYTTSS